jgi:anti-sigma regulatory factor (Ser/Thr protein kinase)
MAGPGAALRIPAAETTWTCSRIYPALAEQVGQVRGFLAEVLAGCPMVDDAVLVGSELAANAITHSDSRKPGGQFIVQAEAHEGDYLWIEVEDQGGPWFERDSTDEAGRGLRIVAELASDWGVEGDCLARVVWARFNWPGR